MKNKRSILRASAILLISFTVVTSCRKDNQAPSYSYFVSKDLVVSYNTAYVNALIDLASISVPEAANLKPLVSSDIDIYKIVYKTTIKGNTINASGLVCVPKTPGSYPVLSFQNGTNTVNSEAPSLNPDNYLYQLVEIIASMKYIVVIADYPGFGASSQIPHPYLIAEPTVRSVIDMLYAVKELAESELPGITQKNEYYLLGYSQGGWATLALHKAIELNYSSDFNLKASACGAGPYDINLLMQGILNQTTYPMPVYLGYILNAYTSYNQFTNPVSDIFNEPYASRNSSLFNGLLTSDAINAQLTTSISALVTPAFLAGYATSPNYASVRNALKNNSVSAWNTLSPVLLIQGGSDTQVNPVSTQNMYTAMIQAGTTTANCKKVILPGFDHSDGIAPCMARGFLFLDSVRVSK